MLLDFDDYRPESPRITAPISVREAVLMSFIAHLILVIAYLVAPKSFFELFEPSPEQLAALQPQEPLRYVEVTPLRDLPALPKLPAVQSDMDRRASSPEKAPVPENTAPRSTGNTPEQVVGGPKEQAAGQPEASPPAPDTSAPLPDNSKSIFANPSAQPPQPAVAKRAPGNLGDAFRNLDKYLRDDTFNNKHGGEVDQSADFSFDSMGIDFGPWLRQFKAQVERNWSVPAAIESFKGRVVIQFGVLRNGTIINLNVLRPAQIQAFTISAMSALKLSNPTAPLPSAYPVEPAIITVTFHYNELPPYGP